jgi:hypothetical protein
VGGGFVKFLAIFDREKCLIVDTYWLYTAVFYFSLIFVHMNYLRHGIKYLLWFFLAVVIVLVLLGLIKYNFDLKWYVDYLNSRNINDVSITRPITIFRVFVPGETTEPISLEDLLQEDEDYDTISGSLDIDIDFESFFGDFSQQDRASQVMAGEDFGFVSEPTTTSWDEPVQRELTEEEQKQLFLEQLRLRELRLQQEAEMNAWQ